MGTESVAWIAAAYVVGAVFLYLAVAGKLLRRRNAHIANDDAVLLGEPPLRTRTRRGPPLRRP
jgi:hypothetical protein